MPPKFHRICVEEVGSYQTWFW